MAEELSLYRRWRPKRFAEVVGQELVVATLKRAVAQGKLYHAYLFAGQRGVGKTTLARLLARAANCLAPEDGEPCNRCPNCVRILSGQSLDVVEIDGASHRGIDQVRQLREEVAFLPVGARYKVYIIDEVHMLTQEAFNALLKTLEEPPAHVIFMFATTEPHKVPATVLSRCQAFWLRPIPEELIAKKIKEVAQAEGFALSEGAAEFLARRSGGSLRDALVLLEQLGRAGPITSDQIEAYLGLPPRVQLDAFLEALVAKDGARALEIIADLARRGRDFALFVEEALSRARDRVVAGEDELLSLLPDLVELRAQLPRAFSRRLHLELFVLEKCGVPKPSQPDGLKTSFPPAEQEKVVSPKDNPGESLGLSTAASATENLPCYSSETSEKGEAFRFQGAKEDDRWAEFLRAAWEKRADLGVFLAPAQQSYVDGVLRLVLPEGFRFHYESLKERELLADLEEVARKFYDPLLAVEISYAGDDGPKPLTFEEAVRLLAESLEGKIIGP
ncbi:MAG: DNA polymerase III subunit gamma/tau [Candidatus Bipolaricaulota bacterium]|nr:DNA polymerase III subunit gamma/tau [Candidatus Bipolaricaulota bacterium]MDW8126930.1 DNA polymerase III subunit gamma/tau [Candidatus Bipolaricaulota bacterium]